MSDPHIFTITDDEAAQIHVCLKLANAIGQRMEATRTSIKGLPEWADFDIDRDMVEVVLKEFHQPLADRRHVLIGLALLNILATPIAPSCFIWELAHMLHHIIYEPDLDALEKGMVQGR